MTLDPNIFLAAADMIERGNSSCCCYAIWDLEQPLPGCSHENFFIEWFAPVRDVDYSARTYRAYWMEMGMDDDEESIRDRRILALCMAATMAADGVTD